MPLQCLSQAPSAGTCPLRTAPCAGQLLSGWGLSKQELPSLSCWAALSGSRRAKAEGQSRIGRARPNSLYVPLTGKDEEILCFMNEFNLASCGLQPQPSLEASF